MILVCFFGVVAPAPFLCWFAAFSAGETQIWPGDLRVVAVLPGFCLFYLLHGSASLYEAKTFHTFCNFFNRFSHCQDQALERNRPQQRKKKGTSFKRPMTLQKFRSSLLDFQRPHDKFAAAKTSYRGGPHMRSLISIDFPAPEMEPESACGIGCLRSLAPMRRLQCSTTQATFTNPSLLRATPRYSATPWYVLIQLPNVIDTMSK